MVVLTNIECVVCLEIRLNKFGDLSLKSIIIIILCGLVAQSISYLMAQLKGIKNNYLWLVILVLDLLICDAD